jgi:hypothetical protein
MNKLTKWFLPILLVFSACTKKTTPAATTTTAEVGTEKVVTRVDMPKTTVAPEKGYIGLKDMEIGTAYLNENKKLKMNNDALAKYAIAEIDPNSAAGNYFVLEALHRSQEMKSYLIGKTTPDDENTVWVATYDSTHRLIQSEKIYYQSDIENTPKIRTTFAKNIIIIDQTIQNKTSTQKKRIKESGEIELK